MSAINAISTGLSVISFTFFLIGIIGYAPQIAVLQDIHWIRYSEGNDNVFFGLQNFFIDYSGFHNVVEYGSDECNNNFDFCDHCERDGQAVGGLLIIALFFTTISIGLSGASIKEVSKSIGISNIVMSFIAFAVSLVGIVIFMGECFSEIKMETSKPQWGPAAILSIVGMVLMGIVFLLQIVGVAKPV